MLHILVLFAPWWGKLKVLATTDYKILEYKEQTYAIIIDNFDSSIVQTAEIKEKCLVIETDTYTRISMDGIEVQHCDFDSVILQSSDGE